ncbi:aminopeptidase P N-terminal domain-containing protein [Arenibacter sp. ARW7G5Y1]|uniref:aminopeptidase P N-terminal domain-containing protein n=1 Tax=Arenibacter sp. ARW7G5Y1 TaxID=2135619 RepID=UPI000D76E1FD|nr:aminopeptidase P N-terminal domain-containing protein [Arenibacter sp. ARW7G5Y1]PXX25384.1 Xaa-Pro aminopeptidase [Arenibacter sp. ARW7G5Y1]
MNARCKKNKKALIPLLLLLTIISTHLGFAQNKPTFQTDFSAEDFSQRREIIFNKIGANALALVQGSEGTASFGIFRQSNNFYYLCGIESPHSYLLLNGKNKTSTLYLPHQNKGKDNSEGKTLSAEDADLIKQLTGVNFVKGLEFLSSDLIRSGLITPPAPILYVPLSPAEKGTDSRDQLLALQARISSDPWDGRPSREARFKGLLNERFPQFVIKDLSPILDSMRIIKSQKEIEVIRKSTKIAGLGIMEAMRSTNPGIYEYQLDAAAKYIFHVNGARGDGYASIIGGGTNASMGHYYRKTDKLNDGDLVLMDYAPDYHYYTSDVTRIWPVNGKFNKAQSALYNFVVAYRDALLKYIKPGVTSSEVLELASTDMKQYLVGKTFANPSHLKAVEKALSSTAHFQHPVGMAVHDVGNVRNIPLKPGMVFTIDPMFPIPEEQLYIRIEDVVVVTKDGVENLSDFVPSKIEDVERTIKEKGLTEFRPATLSPPHK